MSAPVPVGTPVSARADDIFTSFTDLGSIPTRSAAVTSVEVQGDPTGTGGSLSRWKVRFGGGMLHWSEIDRLDPVARELAFEVVDGDIPDFSGRWHVTTADDRVVASFSATFDLGLPELDEALAPVAGRELVTAVTDILRGVLGPGARSDRAEHRPVVPA
ncbi:SRPBCC family protein [Nakamurella leprariae]|uniref:SRPBCC family protein n=1 Tax=Nakamurella leprariae TaxID=2803911 RepID=A0A938YFD3_9ACTN|nr:SRPBCC family protein [Nakamurella leprariae]MBM9466788.1 SRPBCC family protein [Nakamurella leprariae]